MRSAETAGTEQKPRYGKSINAVAGGEPFVADPKRRECYRVEESQTKQRARRRRPYARMFYRVIARDGSYSVELFTASRRFVAISEFRSWPQALGYVRSLERPS